MLFVSIWQIHLYQINISIFFLSLPLVICLFLAVGGSFEYKHERLYAPLRPKPNQGPVWFSSPKG